MSRIIMIMLLCCTGITAHAQNNFIRQGNKLYEQGKYKDAAAAYQQALTKDPMSAASMFNLGNTLYQQKQFDAARNALNATMKTAKTKNDKGAASYNVGNTYMTEQKWEDAINAYKQALRNNPQDADAKYNLSYAQAMLKKEQGGGGGKDDKDKDKKDNKDQKGDNKDEDKNGDQEKEKKEEDKNGKDKQDENKQNDEKKEGEDKKPSQPSKLSEQQADQLLNALQQEEKKLQDKMQKEKGRPVKVDKDW